MSGVLVNAEDVKTGDTILASGQAYAVLASYHNPLFETPTGKAWTVETNAGDVHCNSLDQIRVSAPTGEDG